MTLTCGVIVWDERATSKAGRVVFRPCGAPAGSTISIRGDTLFATCQRHNRRLERAGIRDGVPE